MLLTLLTYVLYQAQNQGKIYKVFTYFSSGGTIGKPISFRLHLWRGHLLSNRFQCLTKSYKSWLILLRYVFSTKGFYERLVKDLFCLKDMQNKALVCFLFVCGFFAAWQDYFFLFIFLFHLLKVYFLFKWNYLAKIIGQVNWLFVIHWCITDSFTFPNKLRLWMRLRSSSNCSRISKEKF